MDPMKPIQKRWLHVSWKRNDTFNEVTCRNARYATILVCENRTLLRIDKINNHFSYTFRFEQFQRFPRCESDFTKLQCKISAKKYFDTYRCFLNGDLEQFFAIPNEIDEVRS